MPEDTISHGAVYVILTQHKIKFIFLFFSEKETCCGYSLEGPCQAISYEYPHVVIDTLTVTGLLRNLADYKLMIFFLFFPENKLRHFI